MHRLNIAFIINNLYCMPTILFDTHVIWHARNNTNLHCSAMFCHDTFNVTLPHKPVVLIHHMFSVVHGIWQMMLADELVDGNYLFVRRRDCIIFTARLGIGNFHSPPGELLIPDSFGFFFHGSV